MAASECRQVRGSFLALEEDALGPSRTAQIRGHVSGCTACRAAWAAWQADDRLLRDSLGPAGAPRDVVDAVMAAIRQPVSKRTEKRRLGVGQQVALILAAEVLIVLAATVLMGGRTRRVGEVVALSGQLLAQPPGARHLAALGLGDRIYEGCQLLTGPRDMAELAFQDGSQLLVKEGAELTLERVRGQGDAGTGVPHVCLSRGEVHWDLKESQSSRHIGTPLGSVIAERGMFRMRYVPEVMLVVQLFDGAGVLSYPAGEMRLNPGEIWVLEAGADQPWKAPGTIWGR